MTSSGTGQSSSVDVTHSLWRMTNPPCRIVPAAATNDVICLGHGCVLMLIFRCSNHGNFAA